MPKASVSLLTEHFDLKTLEGGWIDLKRMNYGQKLERAQMATDMQLEMTKGAKTQLANIDIMQRVVTVFDFKNCVADHNLFEDDEEQIKIDFTRPNVVDKLDPRVGDEIASLIDDMNNFEDSDLGN